MLQQDSQKLMETFSIVGLANYQPQILEPAFAREGTLKCPVPETASASLMDIPAVKESFIIIIIIIVLILSQR